MKKQLATIAMMLATASCSSTTPQPEPAFSSSQPPTPPTTKPAVVIARAGDAKVTLDQLERPLIEGYGLNILLNLVQLELVRQSTAKQGITVSPQDIQREREITIEKMFEESNRKLTDKIATLMSKNQTAEADKLREQIKQDNDQAFEQFLGNQHISRAEFDIVTETNAHLRKLAEPLVKGKISDDNLREAFGALYGETVKCRHIQCANLQEIQQAKQRLAAGEPFAKVAQDMSRNPGTGPLGGQLPPFSHQMQGLPQAFKDAAFALKEGQVSEIVQAEGNYHLILLEQRIPPKIVKFEDVKESIRADLEASAVQATMANMRQQLADQAVAALVINDPVMKKQWEDRFAKRQAAIRDKQKIKDQMDRERARNASATQPAATQPATTQPDGSDLTPAK